MAEIDWKEKATQYSSMCVRNGEVMDSQEAEIERLRELLTHARNGGEVQNCEACGQWFRLEKTHSMDEGGWICKGCAGSSGSVIDTGQADD